MKLPSPSVRKLFRECFAAGDPITIDPKNRANSIRFWSGKLEKIEGVRLTNHPGDRDSRSRTLCRFTIPDPNDGQTYWRTNELRLETDDQQRLLLRSFSFRGPDVTGFVSDAAEIEKLVADVLRRYNLRHAAERKRSKIRQFKSKAIIAKVATLAKEEQFDFATVADSQKLKLFVRLSDAHLVEIHIPFTRFEVVLPRLRTTITTMRELYNEGLRFQVTTDHGLPWQTQWVRHDAT